MSVSLPACVCVLNPHFVRHSARAKIADRLSDRVVLICSRRTFAQRLLSVAVNLSNTKLYVKFVVSKLAILSCVLCFDKFGLFFCFLPTAIDKP